VPVLVALPALLALPLVPVIQVAPVALAAQVVKDSFSSAEVRAVVASQWAKCRRMPLKAAKS
jgi:hypothetical protein